MGLPLERRRFATLFLGGNNAAFSESSAGTSSTTERSTNVPQATPKRRSLIVVAAAAFAVAAISAVAASGASSTTVASFNLAPNPKFIKCLAQYPNDPSRPPSAKVDVVKGNLNDRLTLHLHNIKPNLAFDLFTVQRSSLDADGKPIIPAPSFGLAWYQSDVQANSTGNGDVSIQTILADQIFGVNLDQTPPNPINTFHVGFWFNDPGAAKDCGFDPRSRRRSTASTRQAPGDDQRPQPPDRARPALPQPGLIAAERLQPLSSTV